MLGGALPAFRGWDSRIIWKCQSSLCYIGDSCLKRKEIWSSVDASFSQILFMQAWGLAFSHQHPQRKSRTVVCACDPSTGEQETRGCLGLASKLVWLSQILRVLFKIRQWEIEEDSDAPPEASCTHTHSNWEISSFFHELEFLCLYVCEECMPSTLEVVLEHHVESVLPFHLYVGIKHRSPDLSSKLL